MNDLTKLDWDILVFACEKHHEGARRVPLDAIMTLPQVERDSRGVPSVELWRTLDELQEDGLLQLRDLKIIRGSHGTYRQTRQSQNPGILITPAGILWVARRTATEDPPNEMPDRSGDLNKAIMALVYREYHAGRPATTMETVMDLKLAKKARKDVVYSHIADLGGAGLLNLGGIAVIAGKAVVMEPHPVISITEAGCRFVERNAENGSSNNEDRSLIKPTAFRVPKSARHSEPSLMVAVMMPFQKDFDIVYETIDRACSKLGFTARRVDDMWLDQTIIQDIFTLLYQADIVIVDFSGSNPNVMYETGIAHTLGKTVIPIAQNIETDVPFDMRHHRILKYLSNQEGLEGLFAKLHEKLRQYSPD